MGKVREGFKEKVELKVYQAKKQGELSKNPTKNSMEKKKCRRFRKFK